MEGALNAAHDELPHTLDGVVRERLKAGQLALPTLPDLALRIDALVGAPDASASRVAAAISQDPATAGRLIHAANSAYSAGRVRVQSVQGAVTRLGLAYTRALIHRVTLEQMFLAQSLELRQLARDTWNASLAVAALSEALARICSDLPADSAMIAGLLHGVGVLPLIRLLDEEPELLEGDEDIGALADALSPTIGQSLLAHWGFPRMMQEVPLLTANPTYHHHGPPDLADVVLAARFGQQIAAGHAPQPPQPALDKLGLDSAGAYLDGASIAGAHESAQKRLAC